MTLGFLALSKDMLSIYQVTFDVENYRLLAPLRESDFDGKNLWIDGSLKLSSWKAPAMRYAEKQSESEGVADITQITPGFFAFNSKAAQAFGELLEKNGELLELPIDGEILNAFNPHNELPCFNEEKSEYKVRRGGQKGRLVKPAFDVSKIPSDTALFQVTPTVQTQFYVTERFVEVYKEAGLSGLIFEAVT